jgi:hypothetical protein
LTNVPTPPAALRATADPAPRCRDSERACSIEKVGKVARGMLRPSTMSTVFGLTPTDCSPNRSICRRAKEKAPSPADRTPTSDAAPITMPRVERSVRTGLPRRVWRPT